MHNFILHTPTKILFGKDQIADVAGKSRRTRAS